MKVYWLELRRDEKRPSFGFGITAYDWDDAMSLLAKANWTMFAISVDVTMIENWREVQNIDELDKNHVVPNMGMFLRRGVWFPNLPEVQ